MTSGQKQIPIGLRLPPELASWIRSQAQQNQRSVSNQVAWVLQQFRRLQDREAGADTRS